MNSGAERSLSCPAYTIANRKCHSYIRRELGLARPRIEHVPTALLMDPEVVELSMDGHHAFEKRV